MIRVKIAPLKGIRVVDISTSYAGPFCSMLLADMGAEVIKVEKPVVGDDCRSWGPPFVSGESAWFLSVNRNKKSIALDIYRPEGRTTLYELLKNADVFLENLKPSSISKFGLEYEKVKELNPNIIYCAISGFGQTGPIKNSPGYDLIAQAMSGMMSVTGELNGRPQRVGTAVSDIVTGIISAFSIVTALFHRLITREGTFIDTALLDTDIALMTPRITSYLASGEEPFPCGGTDSVITIYQTLRTADHEIVVATGTNGIWSRFCKVIGRPDLINHPDYHSNEKRKENQARLIELVESILSSHGADYWVEKFVQANVPSAPILKLSKVTTHPQVLSREMIVEIEHPIAGNVKVVNTPFYMNGEKPKISAPPMLGEHTLEVLRAIGVSDEKIHTLKVNGIIQFAQGRDDREHVKNGT